MREWIVKLSAVDGDAASTLRVINHFDVLVDEGASALAILRAATSLADCRVGMWDSERNLRIGLDGLGHPLTAVDRDYETPTKQVERVEEILVWLDREGPSRPLDQLILERLARSLHAVKKARYSHPRASALTVILDPAVAQVERDHALKQLNLVPSALVKVSVTNLVDSRELPPGVVIGDHQVNLWPPSTKRDVLPMTAAMGLLTCAGREIHSKWPLARTALRLAVDPATLGPTHVDYDELGSVAILVDAVDAKAAADSADVRMVFDMSVRRPWVVPTLNAIQRRASAREVARELNLHHSTVQQRIDWLERHLGYTLSSSVGYARMTTTLILWRLVAADARSSSGAETIGGQTET